MDSFLSWEQDRNQDLDHQPWVNYLVGGRVQLPQFHSSKERAHSIDQSQDLHGISTVWGSRSIGDSAYGTD